jgi:hypothetical protein
MRHGHRVRGHGGVNPVCALRSHVHQFRLELADRLVQTGLSAKVLCAGAGEVGRVPAANAQLSGLFVGNKPMVGLPLLGSADVTRYGLPDHRNPFHLGDAEQASDRPPPPRSSVRYSIHREGRSS